jgi:hypothetical protein
LALVLPRIFGSSERGWVPSPNAAISVGAEVLTILLWAAYLLSRRGAAEPLLESGDATLSGAAVNFSSKSCVVTVGGLR